MARGDSIGPLPARTVNSRSDDETHPQRNSGTSTRQSRYALVSLTLLLATAVPSNLYAQDFDPSGRRRGRRTTRSARRPARRAKPSTAKLIKRYTAIVLSTPQAAFPMQKLVQLHRKRDGNLKKLVADFEARAQASGPSQFNARLALAGIYLQAQRKSEAIAILDAAIASHPKSAAPRLMRARLAETKNDLATARRHLEVARKLIRKTAERERLARRLMALCIKLKDFKAASRYHKQLIAAAKGSLFVRKEYGVELFHHGHFARAEVEFRKIVRAAAGDNRALAPALRDLGRALAKQRKMKEALTVLKRARRLAGRQGGIRREILHILTEVYRAEGKLVELIAILKSEGGRDFDRLATIARLHEETGQVKAAMDAYRSALKLKPRNVDLRVKLVRLLQTAGMLETAIREYEALIKAAPGNPDFVFQLAETLIQRGERKKALLLVEKLQQRSKGDADTLAAVADFYERILEPARAIRVFEGLAKLKNGDPQHLIDLGERYFQNGQRARAIATWKKILQLLRNRARALSIVGEVYLQHDMTREALASLSEATRLAPNNTRYQKKLASALERSASTSGRHSRRYRQALKIWLKLFNKKGNSPLLERECRNHIVGLWGILRQLSRQVKPLRLKLNANPPDLRSGRLLAAAQRRLKQPAEAEKTLRQILRYAPGDLQSLLALERNLLLQRKLNGAITVLKRLVEADPRRARTYYQRMAQYAAELYRDDEAIAYASRAVELSPNDAVGHFNLARMYRRRQKLDRAMIELRKAIHKNDRLFRAHFELADLLITKGKVDQADQLYRNVMRKSRDAEFVMRAVRLSMQLNIGKGTLESLELELLPVVLGNPQRPIYRRLLVEMYGAMVFPLIQQAQLGSPAQRANARTALTKIGARAVKPLLDALNDNNQQQQRIAIELLTYVRNKGAGPALFNYATGAADQTLRVRAMLACGAIEDIDLLPRYLQLLDANGSKEAATASETIAAAAAWAVARIDDSRTEKALVRLLSHSSPDVRALGAIGLGMRQNKKHAKVLVQTAGSVQAGVVTRAAAAFALGELKDASHHKLLLALSESSQLPLRMAALGALVQLEISGTIRATRTVDDKLAAALLSNKTKIRRAAMMYAAARQRRGKLPKRQLALPNGAIQVEELLEQLSPGNSDMDAQVEALVVLGPALARTSQLATTTSTKGANSIATLLIAGLRPLLAGAYKEPSAEQKKQLATVSRDIAQANLAAFVALTKHPVTAVRKNAIQFLATQLDPRAKQAVQESIRENDPEVCKAALAAFSATTDASSAAAAIRILNNAKSWALRRYAATALGHLGKSKQPRKALSQVLRRSAQHDAFALVREAALNSYVVLFPKQAEALLEHVQRNDPERQLRVAAAKLRQTAKP
jgi:cellulose synthase operon protein C